MTVDRSYDLLLEQITIWCPIHDLISGSRKWMLDALYYLQGKCKDAPFQPPEWITECINAMNSQELEKLKSSGSNQEAYNYLIWFRFNRRTSLGFSDPKPSRRRKRNGRVIPAAEQAERLRLAPTMTAKEFAAHFQIAINTAYRWNECYGYLLKKDRYSEYMTRDDAERYREEARTTTIRMFAKKIGKSYSTVWKWARKNRMPFIPERRRR